MRVTLDVDTEGIAEAMVRAHAYHPEAHRAATLVLAEQFVAFMDTYMAAHHDTNRFINGWISAMRSVGVLGIAMKPYRKSSRYDQYIERLEEQLEGTLSIVVRLGDTLDRYRKWDQSAPPRRDGKPRKKRMNQPHAREKARKLRFWTKRLEKVQREYDKATGSDTILFFDARITKRKRDFHTVRDKIYGGVGRLIDIGGKLFVELENLEAHARLVEANPRVGHPVRASFAAMRSFGLRRASTAYMDKLGERFGPPMPTDAVSIVDEAQLMHAQRFAA